MSATAIRSETAIRFDQVNKGFGETMALDDVSLDVPRGAFVTVIGSSGCGKTTLLKTVNALVVPDEGHVLVNGRDTAEADPIELRRSIGYAIQGSVLFPHLTVERNIAFVPSLLNKKDTRRTADAVDKWMEIVGLPASLKDRYPSELSGGQEQRVGIARALAASPDILLMDEPFRGLDRATRERVIRFSRPLMAGRTAIVVTHDPEEPAMLGGSVYEINAPSA